MNFENKVVVITGASCGIGQAVLKKVIEKGAFVYCLDNKLSRKKLDNVKYIKVDISEPEQVRTACRKIKNEVDVLINNAGVMRRGDIFESSVKDYEQVMGVNLKGSFLVTKYLRDKLRQNARILFMSSRHARDIVKDPAIYSLSKVGVEVLAELVSDSDKRLRVKVAYPGPVNTKLSKVDETKANYARKKKMMVEPEMIAEKLVYLLESKHEKLLFSEKRNKYYYS